LTCGLAGAAWFPHSWAVSGGASAGAFDRISSWPGSAWCVRFRSLMLRTTG